MHMSSLNLNVNILSTVITVPRAVLNAEGEGVEHSPSQHNTLWSWRVIFPSPFFTSPAPAVLPRGTAAVYSVEGENASFRCLCHP